jgi:DUF1365 family protein
MNGPAQGELASAIYEGTVRHRRHAPRKHGFTYPLTMLYLDLGELPQLFKRRWFWSLGRPNLATFQRNDYLGPLNLSLDEAVRQCVHAATGQRPDGPIRLLTHVRYFGHCFNPASFYYCYGKDGTTLQTIVTEITNTPWKERHAYVLDLTQATVKGRAMQWHFDKTFHVSPFMPMARTYDWHFTTPGSDLLVHMNVLDGKQNDFDATLMFQRRPFNAANLARVLWRFPLMTIQVVVGIHWQALRLWLKGTPIHDHPDRTAVSP